MANEKRMIDVNKVINSMQKCLDESPDKKHSVGYFAFESIIECLKQEPTVDAVEVVRCRDCKQAWIHPCGYVYCHRDGRNAYEMTFNIDSFCSYGERKDGDGNG